MKRFLKKRKKIETLKVFFSFGKCYLKMHCVKTKQWRESNWEMRGEICGRFRDYLGKEKEGGVLRKGFLRFRKKGK